MGRGVFLIRNNDDLDQYCNRSAVAYIQQYLPIDRDIRVVIIGSRVAHAYWRIASHEEFRSNVSRGGQISFDNIPEEALNLALETAKRCGWNDVGIDICEYRQEYFLLEANMKYGKEGFNKAGIDYDRLMEKMIINGEI